MVELYMCPFKGFENIVAQQLHPPIPVQNSGSAGCRGCKVPGLLGKCTFPWVYRVDGQIH